MDPVVATERPLPVSAERVLAFLSSRGGSAPRKAILSHSGVSPRSVNGALRILRRAGRVETRPLPRPSGRPGRLEVEYLLAEVAACPPS